MPRSKRGPALFDLLGKGEAMDAEALKTPEWWSSGDPPPDARVSAPLARENVPSPVPAPGTATGSTGDSARIFELDGGRIRLSFTSVLAAVAVFAALAFLLAAFEWGRWSGERNGFKRGHATGRASYAAGTMDEIEAARRQPPETHVVSSLLSGAAAAERDSTDQTAEMGAGVPEQPRWIQDYTYIVTQEFSQGREDDARQAQAFLTQYGVATELVRYPSGAIQLITTEGFNRRNQTQRQIAEQRLRKVHTVGAKYFETGGRYKLEGYFKTFQGKNW